MNTYFVMVQANAEVPPFEFYFDAAKPGHAIAAALDQVAPCTSVIVACHLYAADVQSRIDDFEVFRVRSSGA